MSVRAAYVLRGIHISRPSGIKQCEGSNRFLRNSKRRGGNLLLKLLCQALRVLNRQGYLLMLATKILKMQNKSRAENKEPSFPDCDLRNGLHEARNAHPCSRSPDALAVGGPCPISGLGQLCIRIKRELFKTQPIKGLLKIRNAVSMRGGLHARLQLFVIGL